MTTVWTEEDKQGGQQDEQELSIGEGFELLIGDGYKLAIQEAGSGIVWTEEIKS